jgi:CheY-like chemotaxis protein
VALTILLADDSVTAQNMGRKILSDAGYDIVAVSNGAAAMKKLAEGQPDILLLDIYMPGYGGLEISERVKSSPATAHIPILLTVGKLEPFRQEDGMKAKADGVIIKPFEATDLLAVVGELAQRVLARKQQPAKSIQAAASATGTEAVQVPSLAAAPPAPADMSSPASLAASEARDDRQASAAGASPVLLEGLADAGREVVPAPALLAPSPVKLEFLPEAPGVETSPGLAGPELRTALEPAASLGVAPLPAPEASVPAMPENVAQVPSAEVLAAVAGFDLAFEGDRTWDQTEPAAAAVHSPEAPVYPPQQEPALEVLIETPPLLERPEAVAGGGGAALGSRGTPRVLPVPGSVTLPQEPLLIVDPQLLVLTDSDFSQAGPDTEPEPPSDFAVFNAVFPDLSDNQVDPALAAAMEACHAEMIETDSADATHELEAAAPIPADAGREPEPPLDAVPASVPDLVTTELGPPVPDQLAPASFDDGIHQAVEGVLVRAAVPSTPAFGVLGLSGPVSEAAPPPGMPGELVAIWGAGTEPSAGPEDSLLAPEAGPAAVAPVQPGDAYLVTEPVENRAESPTPGVLGSAAAVAAASLQPAAAAPVPAWEPLVQPELSGRPASSRAAEFEWTAEPESLEPWIELEPLAISPAAPPKTAPEPVLLSPPPPAATGTGRQIEAEARENSIPAAPAPAVAADAGPVLEGVPEPAVELDWKAEAEIPTVSALPPQQAEDGLAGDPGLPPQQAKTGLVGDPGLAGDPFQDPRFAPGFPEAASETDVLETLAPESSIAVDAPGQLAESSLAEAVMPAAGEVPSLPAVEAAAAALTDAAAEQIVDRILQRLVGRVLENVRPELIAEVKRLLG